MQGSGVVGEDSGGQLSGIKSYFAQKIGSNVLCTICMKCQNLFSGKKKKKNILKCFLLKFLPRKLCFNNLRYMSI